MQPHSTIPAGLCQCGCGQSVKPGRRFVYLHHLVLKHSGKVWLPESERFWSHVDRSGGPNACWLWNGYLIPKGYGQFRYQGHRIVAHRLAWILTNGPVPPGIRVCHNCDQFYPTGDVTYRRCVNPAHLWLGTDADNMADAARKGRMAKGERHGSQTSPAYLVTRPQGGKRGESHWNAKLTSDQVLQIRQLLEAGRLPHDEIARQFGVSSVTVSDIKRRRSWQHLAPPT
jgi:hypothetical protein